MPRGVAKTEHLDAVREDLDLVRRAEDDAEVAVAGGRERVRAIRGGARDVETRVGVALAPPTLHVDDVEDGAVAVDEKQRLEPVAHAVEALDRGQLL